jgi:hypothetical protein
VILFGGGWGKLPNRCLQFPCAADEIGQKLLVDLHAAFVFRQVPFVVGPQDELYVACLRAQGVNERLEYRNSIFGTVPLVAERCESQPVRGTVGQVELVSGSRLLFCASANRVRADATMPIHSLRDAASVLSF